MLDYKIDCAKWGCISINYSYLPTRIDWIMTDIMGGKWSVNNMLGIGASVSENLKLRVRALT